MSASRFARILIAVDGSERASHVLEEGLALARSTGGKVVVLRCVGIPTEIGHEILGRSPEEIERDLVRAAESGTGELLQRLASGVDARLRVEVGVPASTILRVALEETVQLIVVGAHGYRWTERVLGTTASRVVDRAQSSVLVVR